MAQHRPADIAKIARQIYRSGPPIMRKLQHWRPMICPYHILVDQVPTGARVLDVGCGAGLFLGTLAATNRIGGGLGFDSSAPAIEMGNSMTGELPQANDVSFECLDATRPWPEGAFDLISLIDVMHHVPPAAQRGVFAKAAARTAPGKWFLYKDMARRPFWRATANRLHDLVVAREWINYVDLQDILSWGTEEGLTVHARQEIDMLWYRHELILFRRPQ
ncbi:class I SAM-dependent methyltransferase [Roseovarius arcticus]|uniref:class I SAM-dependent methyltransferase n=1 Tax=Roseovarius arcticus TaxID=2547404 RepID=UPI00111044DF|nr:class I SAM-dependent methyltransferase [Roseovarius arcticus]